MIKVLIISYSFPPCNLPAAQRANSWFDYFHKMGLYPIIITRNWDIKISSPEDVFQKTGNETVKTVTEKGEIHYLPYKSNFWEKLYTNKNKNFIFLRRGFTFLKLLLQPHINSVISYKNIFDYSKKMIENNKDIKIALITANPFILFKLGYQLKKKFNLKWIADYRDDWTTDEIKKTYSLPEKIIHLHDKHFERKWVSSAACFTTISEHYKNKISKIIPIEGHVVYNGYNLNDTKVHYEKKSFDKFTIVYNGTLYDSQPIEIFISAYVKLRAIEKYKAVLSLKFIGLKYNKNQEERILNLLNGNVETIEITDRKNRLDVLDIQSQSHLLLMVGHSNLKGITSSKIYEYLSFKKPILLCYGDNDILEKLVTITEKHFICYNSEEIFNVLKDLCDKFINGERDFTSKLSEDFNFYSRENQAIQLASIIKKTLN